MSTTRSEGSTVSTTSLSTIGPPYGAGVQGSSLQVPATISNREVMSTSPAITATTITNRNNVSVTSIKREVDDSSIAATVGGANSTIMPIVQIDNEKFKRGTGMGIRIPLSKNDNESDSETELTNIENLKVTRRAAVSAGKIAGSNENPGEEGVSYHKNGPRPMSWEGELSESETAETELMETENSMSNEVTSAGNGANVSVIKSEGSSVNIMSTKLTNDKHHYQLHPSASVSSLHAIKPDLDQITVEMHNNSGAYLSNTKLKLTPTQSDPINLKYEPPDAGVNSPVLTRNKSTNLPLPANPSPDSAIHSVYTHSSPSQSPLTSRHAPYTPSLSRNNSDASHSSCYSYSSEFSPTHSPIQGRHATSAAPLYGSFNNSLHHSVLYRPLSVESCISPNVNHTVASPEAHNLSLDSKTPQLSLSINSEGLVSSAAGISRQQLINSPCPICGDKISGFHYGIFSCESCKGFFKRTVQNRKNYVCVRGGPCPVSISTRKKCPACRFDKCLQKGMKLEAIREDRTRGGRSTYQCSYTLPNSILSPLLSGDHQNTVAIVNQQQQLQQQHQQQQQQNLSPQSGHHQHAINGFVSSSTGAHIKNEQSDNASTMNGCSHTVNGSQQNSATSTEAGTSNIPVLLQEIMDVEYLWQFNEAELSRLNQPIAAGSSNSSGNVSSTNQMTNPLLASAGFPSNGENANPDLIAHLCNVADHRLYKIVKWCKSLPLFKNISIDDQICLLINSWCELLLFSCCFRSVDTPGEIKMSQGKKITLAQAKSNGLQACIERMLNLTEHLRRLRVDRYEYVAMKVIVLLQSDTSELKEPVKVRECQEKALQSLQAYTLAHYPDAPSKFGELLLRIPDLQRTCQLGKEMLTIKSRDDGDFNLLVELLRGEH